VILLAVLIVENLLEGHVYQPLIMGRSVSLHPIAIVLVVALGGYLDGIVGAIIAIPVAGSVNAAVKYLRGIEDIHGNPLRAEDRMAPEPPPVALVPAALTHGATAYRPDGVPLSGRSGRWLLRR
jgi:hypothetical protein